MNFLISDQEPNPSQYNLALFSCCLFDIKCCLHLLIFVCKLFEPVYIFLLFRSNNTNIDNRYIFKQICFFITPALRHKNCVSKNLQILNIFPSAGDNRETDSGYRPTFHHHVNTGAGGQTPPESGSRYKKKSTDLDHESKRKQVYPNYNIWFICLNWFI